MTWLDNTKKVTPYIPGEQPKGEGIIKLNTNENPFPPSPKVTEVIKKFDVDGLRKYPDPNVSALREEIASYHKISSDNVFVGVGSDDVLAMAFMSFFNSKKPVLFPDITYSFYDVWCELFNINYKTVPLREDFSISKAEYAARNGGVVIANPNAPTGIALPVENISQLVYLNPDVVVIIDEAYVDFHNESALSLYGKYDNLLVVRTFSKSRSLAGSRIGYAIGSKKLIDVMLAVRNSFNSFTMDALTQEIGIASIRDDDYFKKTTQKIIDTREWFKSEMTKLGFMFPNSVANFIFATHPDKPAKELFSILKEKDIYVRYFDKPRINNHLRITIGTPEEMAVLLNTLKEIPDGSVS